MMHACASAAGNPTRVCGEIGSKSPGTIDEAHPYSLVAIKLKKAGRKFVPPSTTKTSYAGLAGVFFKER
jgi:hypothetical protein